MAISNDVPILEEIPDAVGFSHKTMPTGWFQVGWSHDLKAGDVRPMKYFGQQQVMYRGEDGKAVVMSAFCPHFGAHLGYGGRVEGCNIVCPYHGWTWNDEGRNVMAPHEGKPSSANRRVKVYPTVEASGIIWVWHDLHHRDAMWPAPDERRNGAGYLPVGPATTWGWTDVRAHPQYVVENLVDIDHFIYVHKNTYIPELRSESDYPTLELDGPIGYARAKPPRGSAQCNGVGVLVIDLPVDVDRPWRFPGVVYSCTTPIDGETSDLFGTMLVGQDTEAEGGDGEIPVGRALKRVNEQQFQQQADFTIWSNMVYMNRPAYSRHEGKNFIQVRKWTDQFYPEPVAA